MKDIIIIPTYNGTNNLEDMIYSANPEKYLIFTHSSNPDTLNTIESIKHDSGYKNKIVVKDYRKNRGLAKSWNEGINWAIQREYDTITIANDDVFFYTKEDYYTFAKELYNIQNTDIGIIKAKGFNLKLKREIPDHGFAVFGINIKAFKEVGGFDENYKIAYFEDLDYAKKLAKHNYKQTVCNSYLEHLGSNTIYTDNLLYELHHDFFLTNKEYYNNKWNENL